LIEKNGKEISFYFYKISTKIAETETTKNQLFPIAFITENKAINPLAFKAFDIILINDEENLEEKYHLIINQFLNNNHPRASFEKEKTVNDAILEDEFLN
jgi:hypothetical protein